MKVKVRDRSIGRRAQAGALQAVALLIALVWLVCLIMLLAADGADLAVRIAAVAGVGAMFAIAFVWGAVGRSDRVARGTWAGRRSIRSRLRRLQRLDWEEFDRQRAVWQHGERE